MKLLIVNSLYTPNMVGGAEKSVQSLAEALVLLGHKVSVACLTPYERSCVTLNGVTVHYLPLANIHWPFGENHGMISKTIFHLLDIRNTVMGKVVRNLLDSEQPDVIHTNNLAGFSTCVWDEADRLRIPLIHTVRDMYLMCIRSSMFRRGRCCDTQCSSCLISSLSRRAATANLKHVVGISQYILDSHLNRGFFKNATLKVIHNSYVPDLSTTIPKCPSAPCQLKIGYLGRLSEAKGVEYLIREFISAQMGPNVSLLIAGEGHSGYLDHLRTVAADYSVSFLGQVAPAQFFDQIDLLVVPSLWNEPLGRVAIEAMAHGVPTIAARRGGLVEIIKENNSGWLFEPTIVGDLKRLLVEISATPGLVNDMAVDCRKSATEFLPAQIANSYVSVYNNATC